MQEKDFSKTEVKNNLCINVFGYENELVFPIYVSDQKFEDSMDLLILIDDDKSHYVYIKDLDRLCFTKQKIKTKNGFVEGLYSVLVVKMSVCSCHVTYAFESESTLYSCLNVKELLECVNQNVFEPGKLLNQNEPKLPFQAKANLGLFVLIRI